MQVYQGAKQLKLSNKELIELIDKPEVDHHMDRIPDEMLEDLGLIEKKIQTTEQEPTETVDSAETVTLGEANEGETDSIENDVDVDSESSIESNDGAEGVLSDGDGDVRELGECPYTTEQIKLGIRCLGGNAPQYKWRHLIG